MENLVLGQYLLSVRVLFCSPPRENLVLWQYLLSGRVPEVGRFRQARPGAPRSRKVLTYERHTWAQKGIDLYNPPKGIDLYNHAKKFLIWKRLGGSRVAASTGSLLQAAHESTARTQMRKVSTLDLSVAQTRLA